MAQSTVLVLLPQRTYPGPQGTAISYVGDKQQAAAYYLANKDLQTITWNVSGQVSTEIAFVGIIKIQASLVTSPTETDWFNLFTIPTDSVISGYQNLNGNYVWLRASVSSWTAGTIKLVTVSY
jgi:hypothetical protein